MANETFASRSWESIFVSPSQAYLENAGFIKKRNLSIGSGTAYPGMWVTRTAEVTAGTPGTHKDIDLAVEDEMSPQSVINRPEGVLVGAAVPPDGFALDDGLAAATYDGEQVLVLDRASCAEIHTWYNDGSDNVLPGDVLKISATAGHLAKTLVAKASTTSTNAELYAAILDILEACLVATAVSEDANPGTLLITGRMLP